MSDAQELEAAENLNDEEGDEELVFFMRAGYRGSPRWATLFWEGDQMVSWQRNDGIKSAVTGLLSSGVSGYAFNHSDIGGYCTVDLPFIRYRRTEELLLRWMELNAFSVVFRSHEVRASCNHHSQLPDSRTVGLLLNVENCVLECCHPIFIRVLSNFGAIHNS